MNNMRNYKYPELNWPDPNYPADEDKGTL